MKMKMKMNGKWLNKKRRSVMGCTGGCVNGTAARNRTKGARITIMEERKVVQRENVLVGI